MTDDCKVGAVLFHSDDMMTLGSGGVFSLHYSESTDSGIRASSSPAREVAPCG